MMAEQQRYLQVCQSSMCKKKKSFTMVAGPSILQMVSASLYLPDGKHCLFPRQSSTCRDDRTFFCGAATHSTSQKVNVLLVRSTDAKARSNRCPTCASMNESQRVQTSSLGIVVHFAANILPETRSGDPSQPRDTFKVFLWTTTIKIRHT